MAYISVLPAYTPIRLSFDGLKTFFAVCAQRRALAELDGEALKDIGITPAQAAIESRRFGWDTSPLLRHR